MKTKRSVILSEAKDLSLINFPRFCLTKKQEEILRLCLRMTGKVLRMLPIVISLIGFFKSNNAFASDKIKIVTTTTTVASLAQEIAGDKAEIYSIASPNRDIHFIVVTPKDVLKVKKADVFIHMGLDLEAWRGPLLDAVGRAELMGPDSARAIDTSKNVPLLEVPTSLSRIQGDIHAFGNPHYWTDPVNAGIMAKNIAEGLSRLYPEDSELFNKNLQAFDQQMQKKIEEWQSGLKPYENESVVVYHNSWPYFMQRFHLQTAGYLEPKPGIPPTPKHIQELVGMMTEKKVKVIVKEVFHENGAPNKIAKQTGAEVVTLYTETGQVKGSYFDLIDYDVNQLKTAFAQGK